MPDLQIVVVSRGLTTNSDGSPAMQLPPPPSRSILKGSNRSFSNAAAVRPGSAGRRDSPASRRLPSQSTNATTANIFTNADSQSLGKYVSVFQQIGGGFASAQRKKANDLYFVGIIDFLQKYNKKKQIAHFAKSLRHKGELSTVNPVHYASRFQEFINKSCVGDSSFIDVNTNQTTKKDKIKNGETGSSSVRNSSEKGTATSKLDESRGGAAALNDSGNSSNTGRKGSTSEKPSAKVKSSVVRLPPQQHQNANIVTAPSTIATTASAAQQQQQQQQQQNGTLSEASKIENALETKNGKKQNRQKEKGDSKSKANKPSAVVLPTQQQNSNV